MADNVKKTMDKIVGKGGVGCPCCNTYKGKDRKVLSRRVRRTQKNQDRKNRGDMMVKGYVACLKRPEGMQPPYIYSSPFEFEGMAMDWASAFPKHELIRVECKDVHPTRLITAAECQWEEKDE